jgi:hypothetical protein
VVDAGADRADLACSLELGQRRIAAAGIELMERR